jgi:magnesium-transporting ATPase (P-type)
MMLEIIRVQVAKCAEDVERDLQLTGVTAIEDKLQVHSKP